MFAVASLLVPWYTGAKLTKNLREFTRYFLGTSLLAMKTRLAVSFKETAVRDPICL